MEKHSGEEHISKSNNFGKFISCALTFYSLHTHLQVKTVLDEVLEKLPEKYNMSDITSKTAERSPYILVCFQECERMNTLISEIRRSLKELDLGLKV